MHLTQIGVAVGQVIIIVVSAIWTARNHFERLSDRLREIVEQNQTIESNVNVLDAKITMMDHRIGAQDDRIEGLYLAMQIFVGAPISPARRNRGAGEEMTSTKARGEEDGG